MGAGVGLAGYGAAGGRERSDRSHEEVLHACACLLCVPHPPGSQAGLQDTAESVSQVMEPKWGLSPPGRNSPFFLISKSDSLECALGTGLGCWRGLASLDKQAAADPTGCGTGCRGEADTGPSDRLGCFSKCAAEEVQTPGPHLWFSGGVTGNLHPAWALAVQVTPHLSTWAAVSLP